MSKPQLPKLQSKTFLYGIFRTFIAIIAKSTPAIFLLTQNTNESALEKANSKIQHCQEVSFQQNLHAICIFGKDQSNNTQGQESLNHLCPRESKACKRMWIKGKLTHDDADQKEEN
jgi:hypothetical protein